MDKDSTKAIDIYRGFLAQYIILSHLIPALFPKVLGVPGTLAVWCFFVISGYLNFTSLCRSPGAVDYFRRRIIRLYPLLIISFVTVTIFSGLRINEIYTLIPAVFWIKGHMPSNGVLWTIVIELQLYLLTPALAVFLMRIPLKKWMVIASLAFAPALSILLSILASKVATGGIDLDDRTFLSALPFYFFGMVLGLARHQGLKIKAIGYNFIPAVTALLFVIVVVSRNSDFIPWPSLFLEGRYIPVLLTGFLLSRPDLFRVFSDKGIFSRNGQLTYEIYLFHGLFAFIMYRFVAAPGYLMAIVCLWVLPLAAAFSYNACRRLYVRKAITA
ncbi:MAG TPA: hypothetical protein DEA55_03210 [Rhodospirillaceae bacterium]|nr:hypothetical protein [Rhodospirillaceae bacterium]